MEEGFQNLNETPIAQREFATPNRSSKKPNRLLFLLLFIGIIGLLLFLGRTFFSKNVTSEKQLSSTPTPTSEQVQELQPTEIPVTEVPPTPSLTPKPTVNPIDKSSGLDRSELSVAVRNGSGEVGAASKASDILKSFGYHVVSMGNADNFEYQNISIEVKTSKSSYLSLLQKDLGLSYTIGSTSASLFSNTSADAVVTVGK